MENNLSEACTCGKTHAVFYPDENQYEPACWECYFTQQTMEEAPPTESKMYTLDDPDSWPF